MLTGMTSASTGVLFPPDALRRRDGLRTLPHLLKTQGYNTTNWGVPNILEGHAQNLVDAFEYDNGAHPSLPERIGAPQILGTGEARWFIESTVIETDHLFRRLVRFRICGIDLQSLEAT